MNVLQLALPAAAVARWRAVLGPGDGVSRPLTALPLAGAEVLQSIASSAAGPALIHALGPAPWCNLAQSWLRHGRPPHAWHQDGALRHDFLAHAGRPAPREALLDMRTLWIALTPCGVQAPSLQWVKAELPGLLSPEEMKVEAVTARFPAASFEHAELQPGEALLFDGALLHRTHLTPTMTAHRLSLELRFFRGHALPARVTGDPGLRLPGP